MSEESVPGKTEDQGPASVSTKTKVAVTKTASKSKAPVKSEAQPASEAHTPASADTASVHAAEPALAFRTIAEQSLDHARTAFTRSREASQAMAKGMEVSGEVVQSGLREMQMRITEAMEQQSHAAFGFMRAMTQANTLSELIDLQSSEMRRGVERSLAEAKDLSALATSIASKASEPMRKAFDLAISSARPTQ
jgi:hypothetical protein